MTHPELHRRILRALLHDAHVVSSSKAPTPDTIVRAWLYLRRHDPATYEQWVGRIHDGGLYRAELEARMRALVADGKADL